MGRPKLEDPKEKANVRWTREDCDKIIELVDGSKQKGFDAMIKFVGENWKDFKKFVKGK